MSFDIVFNKDEAIDISIIIVILVMGIFMYGKYRCDNYQKYKDPFLSQLGIWDIDGWSLLHFIVFVVGGFLYPNMWWFLTLGGVGWEIFETYYDNFKPAILKGYGECGINDGSPHSKWWFGRMSDIMVNTLGVIVGVYLRKYYS